MNTKEKLISKISSIKNESILEDIMKMVDLELDMSDDVVYLNSEQKSFIDKGLEDIESGKLINHQEAKTMTKEWLEKR